MLPRDNMVNVYKITNLITHIFNWKIPGILKSILILREKMLHPATVVC